MSRLLLIIFDCESMCTLCRTVAETGDRTGELLVQQERERHVDHGHVQADLHGVPVENKDELEKCLP